jgi:cysteine synthase A
MSSTRLWLQNAIRTIEADFNRSADTHLIPIHLPHYPNIDFYLKDESSHPTGSLKHRLARSLFLYALANGWLREGSTVIEASSGSTAVSEAYFARLLNLPFIAVMPASTSPEKIAAITFYGGQCHLVENATQMISESQRLAAETKGHFLDQFTYAERATDWRANNNIAESIFSQMRLERHPVPRWIVASAGTGGTSATLGRFVRYRRHDTQIACVDPENSVFFDAFATGDASLTLQCGSKIEGIGRPRVEASFMSNVIDTMFKVPDELSIAATHWLSNHLGRRVGASTGCNWLGVLALAQEMHQRGEHGSIVSILCDSGERYAHSYYNDEWLVKQGFDLSPHLAMLNAPEKEHEIIAQLKRCDRDAIASQ